MTPLFLLVQLLTIASCVPIGRFRKGFGNTYGISRLQATSGLVQKQQIREVMHNCYIALPCRLVSTNLHTATYLRNSDLRSNSPADKHVSSM